MLLEKRQNGDPDEYRVRRRRPALFIVTNEVGWGIVPEAALGRRFREVLGRANRIVAGRADEVILMVSGLPVRIKGEP
jgi:adenosylcobinamide kinase/adenosylcobinamide-phosphate guanylyltransferase